MSLRTFVIACLLVLPAGAVSAADKSITLDTREQVGTGRNASVNFKGVPLLYLPWLSFPLSDARKSGFLFPSIGHSNRSEFQFSCLFDHLMWMRCAPQEREVGAGDKFGKVAHAKVPCTNQRGGSPPP